MNTECNKRYPKKKKTSRKRADAEEEELEIAEIQ